MIFISKPTQLYKLWCSIHTVQVWWRINDIVEWSSSGNIHVVGSKLVLVGVTLGDEHNVILIVPLCEQITALSAGIYYCLFDGMGV